MLSEVLGFVHGGDTSIVIIFDITKLCFVGLVISFYNRIFKLISCGGNA